MAGGRVTTGEIAALATQLARQLGRGVTVHNNRFQYTRPGTKKPVWTPWRYTVLIQGVNPFDSLTVEEAKSRMAMLSSLLYAKVITAGDPPDEPSRTHENRPSGGDVASGGDDKY